MQPLSDSIKYRVGLSFFEGIGPVRFNLLKSYFGSAERIYNASEHELRATGLGTTLVDRFLEFRKSFDLEKYVASFLNKGINCIGEESEYYPDLLRTVESKPFILYMWGNKQILKRSFYLGIVGTRRPTRYGIEVTDKISSELARFGIVIVSGMAMGIDAIAHSAALKSGGETIAVLGCGVDICYPAVNRRLYESIKEKGLILSEFPPGKRSSKGVFPSRNRIVAGMSRGVVVTEGSEKSGSLITARFASEYGRDVFAIPGPITSDMSKATTLLLREGAIPAASSQDILQEYGITNNKNLSLVLDIESLSDQEKDVITIIKQHGTLHVDQLARLMFHHNTSEAISLISALEIRGILKEQDNGVYSLNT